MNGKQVPCPSGRYWRVQPGDTLYTIAERMKVSIDDLQRLNPGVDPYNLRVGASLCLPEELPPCESGLYWKIASGDTLSGIAAATGTSVEKLLELNPNLDPYNLRIDQAICLPALSEISPNPNIIKPSTG